MSSYQSILNVLNNKLAIEHLFLENESSMHNVPANSETHFKLIVVSDDFIESVSYTHLTLPTNREV